MQENKIEMFWEGFFLGILIGAIIFGVLSQIVFNWLGI